MRHECQSRVSLDLSMQRFNKICRARIVLKRIKNYNEEALNERREGDNMAEEWIDKLEERGEMRGRIEGRKEGERRPGNW